MTGATICSGIGAPEASSPQVEWAWCAEIDEAASKILANRYPTVPNLGDITDEDFIPIAKIIAPELDVIVGGTPCQAWSLIGARRSLDDQRANLALRFTKIIYDIKPKYVIWENVPAVLSAKDNAFGCFLAALVGADSSLIPARRQRWTRAGMVDGPERSAAWRVLDASYWGLAKHRERLFVVSNTHQVRHSAEILFEREGMQGNPEAGVEARERIGRLLPCLTRRGAGSLREEQAYILHPDGRIRHPLPIEYERAQGFSDGYTAVEGLSDTLRYRAIGNSMAVPVLRWIISRVEAALVG